MKYSLRSLMIVVAVLPPLLAVVYFTVLLLWPVRGQVFMLTASISFLGAIAALLAHIHRYNRDKI
jgi:hypothetical protein